jgi:ADP-ribosyl-[dinitrogen reductase] hydrolase
MALELSDRLVGGLFGLLVGDAIGVPFEFHSREEIPVLDLIGPALPAGFVRAHSTAPVGAWSDDGAQALCLLESLLDCGKLDTADLGRKLVAWFDEGRWAVGGRVFDVGQQTARALAYLRRGLTPELAGPRGPRDNGNGALMRVLPLALWHTDSDDELVASAGRQSALTHGHPRSQICCALYCLWVRAILDDDEDPWNSAIGRLRKAATHLPEWLAELESEVLLAVPPRFGSGYVVDTLHAARAALHESTFQDVVARAISYGLDTDTTAAVAGGIAGVRFGMGGIPADWLAHLAGRDVVFPLVERLLESRISR